MKKLSCKGFSDTIHSVKYYISQKSKLGKGKYKVGKNEN
jgi:hypothetical protein